MSTLLSVIGKWRELEDDGREPNLVGFGFVRGRHIFGGELLGSLVDVFREDVGGAIAANSEF